MNDTAEFAATLGIAWVAPGIRPGELDPAATSSFASNRYRVLLPGIELQARGHRIHIVNPEPGIVTPISSDINVVIVGKFTNPDLTRLEEHVKAALDYAEQARQLGIRIVVDICDNHFDDPVRGEFARAILQIADAVVVGSSAMGEVVRRYSALPQKTIPDPVEGRRGVPALASGIWQAPTWWSRLSGTGRGDSRRPLRLLWFGHQSGLLSLEAALPEIEALSVQGPIELEVVCAPGFTAEAMCDDRARAGDLTMRFSAWSAEQTWRSLQRADIVVIPGDRNDEKRSVKTENRLVESLWAGRYVVANPIPAYQRFEDCAWISEDLATGIRSAVRTPELAVAQIARGQALIQANYLPQAIGAQWEAWIRETLDRPRSARRAAAVAAAPAVRLNLGCGDKILPGYVNVDVAASRNGAQPDVLCDLHDLSAFASGTADEILSVHVVEHFWRWEVEAILAEWVRVLKPGGRMIVECPNLAAACEALLADPDAGPGVEGNRSLWVLYGDPAWRDPLMCHRWGYTPTTLARLLQGSGLVDVRQEAAQFKMREPRDMRVVGVKPQ
jgi:SAM-dependent methyltransferase